MLNRRILRIKAFKTIYALTENPSMSAKDALAQLEASCEATRDLYLFMLALLPALTDHAKSRIAASQAKFNPTQEELHPNLRFVQNSIAARLSADPDFTKAVDKRRLSWDQYDVLLRHLYDSLKASDYYAEYLASEPSVKADAKLFISFYERELVDNTELEGILEDMSMWWNDDLAYSLTWCCHAMDDFAAGRTWRLPELYMSQMDGADTKDSDLAFVQGIVRKAATGVTRYWQMVADLTPKWNKDRICMTDLALIMSGLAESEAFPQMPAKVILNEYVEISKFYSTPESKAFVNGLLDKLINKQQ